MDESSRDKGKRAAGNPAREPRTIDLTPSEIVEETAPVASHAADPKAGDGAKAQREKEQRESVPPRDPVDAPAGQQDAAPRRRLLRAWLPAWTSPPWTLPVVPAALGGLVGALVVLAGWWLITPRDTTVTRLRKLERTLDQALLDAVRRTNVERVDDRVSEVTAGLKAANDRLAAVSSKADETARRLATAPAPSQAGGAGAAAADLARAPTAPRRAGGDAERIRSRRGAGGTRERRQVGGAYRVPRWPRQRARKGRRGSGR